MAVKEGDWRSTCDTLKKTWLAALHNGCFTDVNIIVGGGVSGKRFSAHKCVLAFCSPVFEAMFFGPVAEKGDIEIPDISPKQFQAILMHAYGQETSFKTLLDAVEVYIAADKYLMSVLKCLAEGYIKKSQVKKEDFWAIALTEYFFRIDFVNVMCLKYFNSCVRELLESNAFTSVPTAVIKAILKMENLNCTEPQLMEAVIKWAKKNAETESQYKTQMKTFMTFFRFSGLSTREFCRFLDLSGNALDHKYSLMIMKHLHDNTRYPLPDWCSKKKARAYGKYSQYYY